MTDLHWLTLSEVCRRMKSGELTSKAVTEHTLNRITATDDRYRAFVTVTADAAMASAERLDAARAKGEPLGPLHGVPIALKDLLWTRGVKTTCGTKVLANWVPDEDSTTVTRLKEAGAVIVGKVKLTEGAFSDHHPEVDPPRNVWDPAVWPGVSSSGFRRGGRRGARVWRHRYRHRRQHPFPVGVERHRRHQADVRQGQPPWRLPPCGVVGSHRADGAHRRRRGAHARSAGRSRPTRSDVDRISPTELRRFDRRVGARHAHRHRPRVCGEGRRGGRGRVAEAGAGDADRSRRRSGRG